MHQELSQLMLMFCDDTRGNMVGGIGDFIFGDLKKFATLAQVLFSIRKISLIGFYHGHDSGKIGS